MLDLAKRAILPVAALLVGIAALIAGWVWLALAMLIVVSLGLYDFLQRRCVVA